MSEFNHPKTQQPQRGRDLGQITQTPEEIEAEISGAICFADPHEHQEKTTDNQTTAYLPQWDDIALTIAAIIAMTIIGACAIIGPWLLLAAFRAL